MSGHMMCVEEGSIVVYCCNDLDSGKGCTDQEQQQSNCNFNENTLGDEASNVSKKALAKMKSKQIFEEMSSDEQSYTSSLQAAKFLHIRKITFEFVNGCLVLKCMCCTDERCGLICRHKFHVYEKYLQPMGYREYNHRSVHCMNWSQYCFLGNRSKEDMTQEELQQWNLFEECYMRGYEGTFCEHTVIGDLQSFQQHFIQAFGNNSIPQRNGKDISELYSLPAAMRVLNFSQDYVRKCIAEYGESFYDKVNMLSQVDNEGFEINNQAHPLETVAHDSDLQVLVAEEEPQLLSVQERESVYTKKMHEMKNMFNFKDVEIFEELMK